MHELHRRQVDSIASFNTRDIGAPALPAGELICHSSTV
jgi:hypothetical protein